VSGQPVILGVSGGSGSGKSTVVREVVRILGEETASVVRHDWYYRDLGQLTYDERSQINFDHPDSLETELLASHLRALISGEPVEVPTYDFTIHARAEATRRVDPTPLVILDGILVLANAELRGLMDYRVFVDTAPDVRLSRRVRRDTSERGRTAESVLDQYERTVRPMHLEFVEPSRRFADLTISEGGYNRVAVDLLVTKLRGLLSGLESNQPAGHAGAS